MLIRQLIWQIWTLYDSFTLSTFCRRYTLSSFGLNNETTWKTLLSEVHLKTVFPLYRLSNVSWCVLTSRRVEKMSKHAFKSFPLESVSLNSHVYLCHNWWFQSIKYLADDEEMISLPLWTWKATGSRSLKESRRER